MDCSVQSCNYSFTSRSPQIKDAQWVCRKVRSFPHISTTRISAPMWNLKEENPDLYDRFSNQKPFEHFISKSKEEQKLVRLFAWQKALVQKIRVVRSDWNIACRDDFHRIKKILNMFKYDKLGNCGEDAFLAAALVKINGIDNVCTAKLVVDKSPIDHVVCAFNADDSSFEGKAKNNTIIIDPWIGEADFAKNMFVKYKNLCQKFFFNLKPESKIDFREIIPVKLSSEEIAVLKLRYDDLFYPSTNREFMQKK